MVIQIQKNKGRDYIVPTEEDKKIYQNAVNFFNLKKSDFEKENLIPKEKIHQDHTPGYADVGQ